jgi:hypothetical protein
VVSMKTCGRPRAIWKPRASSSCRA